MYSGHSHLKSCWKSGNQSTPGNVPHLWPFLGFWSHTPWVLSKDSWEAYCCHWRGREIILVYAKSSALCDPIPRAGNQDATEASHHPPAHTPVCSHHAFTPTTWRNSFPLFPIRNLEPTLQAVPIYHVELLPWLC